MTAATARAVERQAFNVPLFSILGIGLVLRLLFIGSDGFHNDVAAFESWTVTLRDNPPWAFYAKSGFADYPPGYFVVLWVLAKCYAALSALGGNDAAHGYGLLKTMIKLPAITMDLVDAGVVYAIVRRYAAPQIALIGTALLAFNPAAIYVSSYWGQVDSISWGLVLIGVWCLLRAGDDPAKTTARIAWAWAALAFSVLIKPQGATIGLLFLAYPFATADAVVRAQRLRGTAAGIGAALALAVFAGLVFHPNADVLRWLFERYRFGSNVYPYTSVNAFNLYAVAHNFWQPDDAPLQLGSLSLGALSVWGVALVAGATMLVTGRYLQRRDDRALIEGALLCALAFFVLATRMHERYVYGAFLLTMPLVAFGRTGWIASITLTVTMYLNLAYSLAYQTVMEQHTQGVDATNLWGAGAHLLSLANVVLFFWLGYRYLGSAEQRAVPIPAAAPVPAGAEAGDAWLRRLVASGRAWFSPREGIASLTRTDWLAIAAFVAVAFAIAIVNYGWPPERIFDEIYFARAGEEYLRGINQFEWTHPPFTKLVIALSMLLFGGLHGLGNTAFGWRFLNIVIGAVEVGVVYAFAKRLTASTVFAALAALMLTFDGFHFVESRIATGEITISTLIVFSLYAFYRWWLASQVRVVTLRRATAAPRAWMTARFGLPLIATLVLGIPVAFGFSLLVNLTPAQHNAEIANGIGQATASWTNDNWAGNFSGPTQWIVAHLGSYEVAILYAMLGVYLVGRTIVPRFLARAGARAAYADGTVVTLTGGAPQVTMPPAAFDPPELQVRAAKSGALEYATPDGSATFSPDGVMTVDGERRSDPRAATTWLIVLLGGLGLLASSKWNGIYDFFVVVSVIVLVALQRFLPARALYGNPRGWSPDVAIALILFSAGAIYTLSYLPFFLLGHGFPDMYQLQWQMLWYHSHGVANATHPYESKWWQWPIMQAPISYYYKDFRTGVALQNGAACCVAEILALPNPLVFLLGLISVPYVAYLAWKERHKGYALLVVAYLMQWLPWTRAPRLLFEYHFFPNLALIVLCNAIAIQHVYRRIKESDRRWYLGGYAVAVVLLFAYFYPILAGVPVNYDLWFSRMWPDRLHIPHTSWIVPPH
ncbi:hypothetical protein WPS_21690 [Vulcanimicrobium alpinum]|uniref:Polyprenol-phosphate-mannose--protein mannosyltransferase n=1 Tax=Vulcanimicrobium alpinum TaxID=3016050 RepID=A0AAN1XYY7_UNVUL|nr:phospholipid carrier-dependent glycosyltransferase [Vulcanimicrobium alpinum]BDE06893.1 hypothetical protein WPS_21690 [Vulcanimicrobium alpinum]